MTPLRRYVLYQIPGVAFVGVAAGAAWWAGVLSAVVACGLVALWIAKDAALYPVVRRSYAGAETASERLVGTRAEVRVPLDPVGWVWARGELWRAEACEGDVPVPAGRVVVVRAVEGLVLLVAPVESPARHLAR